MFTFFSRYQHFRNCIIYLSAGFVSCKWIFGAFTYVSLLLSSFVILEIECITWWYKATNVDPEHYEVKLNMRFSLRKWQNVVLFYSAGFRTTKSTNVELSPNSHAKLKFDPQRVQKQRGGWWNMLSNYSFFIMKTRTLQIYISDKVNRTKRCIAQENFSF